MEMTWIITASSFTIYDGGGHNRIYFMIVVIFYTLSTEQNC